MGKPTVDKLVFLEAKMKNLMQILLPQLAENVKKKLALNEMTLKY